MLYIYVYGPISRCVDLEDHVMENLDFTLTDVTLVQGYTYIIINLVIVCVV